ncbi:hypothetical protein [Bartonella machadoae]|uniref:hypothetical protein n=1 Tax=Bartonella machadoae TaxID=2893471 RepID=UPI001F4CB8EF|nr:hypothetical protein [Bartonella machadoae]UNE53801.1 hypothetical protein LNM86_09290 [Bartonella machadoae]
MVAEVAKKETPWTFMLGGEMGGMSFEPCYQGKQKMNEEKAFYRGAFLYDCNVSFLCQWVLSSLMYFFMRCFDGNVCFEDILYCSLVKISLLFFVR